MATICPTVTALDPHSFRQQMENVAHFATRIHVDLMDGLFTTTKSPALEQVWWPHGSRADLHIMYKRPDLYLDKILDLEPSMVIIHAEAEGEFAPFAEALTEAGIKVGVSLLQKTAPELIKPALPMIDHVLIFSGDLGKFGGEAHLHLLGKILKLKQWKPDLEIGWDGGINEKNVKQLARGGVDVLNVGGFIQKANDPAAAYAKLLTLVETAHATKINPRTA